MAKILIVDDDRDIVNALKIYLAGFETCEAYNGREALDIIGKEQVDLVIMDVMMPRLDGIAATVKLRETHNIPLILLTAKSEDSDKVLGLDVGADDYITKPFNPSELLARVRSQLRRYQILGSAQARPSVLSFGGIALDDSGKRVTVDGEEIDLTPTEYAILLLLMKNPGRVFSSDEIYGKISDGFAVISRSTVAVHIRHLREKIEIDPGQPQYIKVVWGQGYKFEAR